jgi:hypothetical protein
MPHKLVKRTAFLCSFLIFTASGTTNCANAADIAGGLKASTLGAGAEVTLGLTSSLNFRTGANIFSYGAATNKGGNPITYDLHLLSFPAFLDWFPLRDESGFRISSGLIINRNKFTANADTAASYDIGGVIYPADQVGTLSGNVKFNNFAPYIGIGWGNPFTTDSRLSFSFDLGVAFQGVPQVSLAASGPIASDPKFQTDLQRESNDIKNEIDAFKFYPVVSAGIAYRF